MSFAGLFLFPTVLVFLGCLPLYYATETATTDLGILDRTSGAATALAATFIEARGRRAP